MSFIGLRLLLVSAAATVALVGTILSPLPAQSQVTSEKCGNRKHEVIVGDVLLTFPVGINVNNIANQYSCPKKDAGPLKGTGNPKLDARITLSAGDEIVYLLYFSAPSAGNLRFDYEGLMEDLKLHGVRLETLPVESGFYVYKPDTEKLRSKYSSHTIYIAKDKELIDATGRPYIFYCSASGCRIRILLTKQVVAGALPMIGAIIPDTTQLAEFADKFKLQATSYIVEPAPK